MAGTETALALHCSTQNTGEGVKICQINIRQIIVWENSKFSYKISYGPLYYSVLHCTGTLYSTVQGYEIVSQKIASRVTPR